ncbi:DsrE/DsrF-like family protein [Polynucleobacter aenigmaticus]|jgi:sulfur relay (sulfurtransferase) complex TusBCD TusD component (DsrE family)|uniref:DsrE/DsrF-like family protein n=2 Tax=Polynucleobacter aenigmaticus TaxID=1743164 RepID=A0A254Q3I6_9BURK|nr:DsrE/DsrF-like family protein [Polynucleobacter aenigmaticus]
MILRLLKSLFISSLAVMSLSAISGPNDPLFINLSTDDLNRSTMAINFGKHHSASGHPLTIFLNDKAVMLGVKTGASKHAEQQQALSEVISAGALVIMCPMCLKQAGYTESDLISGVKLGGPKITGEALFKDGTKTMSW